MGVYLADELETLTAHHIIERLLKTMADISHKIYTNYMQSYVIGDVLPRSFQLDYIPLDDTIFIMINGVAYVNSPTNKFFTYDSDTNTVEWIYTAIPFVSGWYVTIVYSFDMIVNNIPEDYDIRRILNIVS